MCLRGALDSASQGFTDSMKTWPLPSSPSATQPILWMTTNLTWCWEVGLIAEGRCHSLNQLPRTGDRKTTKEPERTKNTAAHTTSTTTLSMPNTRKSWPTESWWTRPCHHSTPSCWPSQRCRGWWVWLSARRPGRRWSGWISPHPVQPRPSALLLPVVQAYSMQSFWMSQTLTWTLLWTFTWSNGENPDEHHASVKHNTPAYQHQL